MKIVKGTMPFFTKTKLVQVLKTNQLLFLNDCVIMDVKEFKNAHKPHVHTYWLKYFMLKTIVNKRKIKFSELFDLYAVIGRYEEHLVRHVAGSLCTANEFRCAEIDCTETGNNIESYKLSATDRGKYLFRKRNNIEFCFETQYLQTIVNDQWLSLPNNFIRSIFLPKLEYSHLYETNPAIYIATSIESVVKNTISILNFIKLLEASYQIEIQKNKPKLHEVLKTEDMLPNFDSINNGIVESAENIVKALSTEELIKVDKIKIVRSQLKTDKSQKEFFENYYKANLKVSL